jgi:hypothetical protein
MGSLARPGVMACHWTCLKSAQIPNSTEVLPDLAAAASLSLLLSSGVFVDTSKRFLAFVAIDL